MASSLGTLFSDVGNGLKYAAEQCTAYLADTTSWVQAGWGSAGNWLRAAQQSGLQTSSVPSVGAIAVWAPFRGGATGSGHVAKVLAVNPMTGLPTVLEANWSYPTVAGVGAADTRAVSASSASGIIGYILPPGGGQMPETMPPALAPVIIRNSTLNLNPFDALPGQIVSALGTALAAMVTAIGHAIAHTLGVTVTDLGAALQNHLVPIVVAAAVTAALFA